jgi:hypothetical protein
LGLSDGFGVLGALFEEPRSEILGELNGLGFEAVEGGDGRRGVFGKEATKDRVGVFVPLPQEFVAIR